MVCRSLSRWSVSPRKRHASRASPLPIGNAPKFIPVKLTRAPGNDAPIGGIKVVTDFGWFAARPSGTENVTKLYAESFRGEDHLERILEEAQAIAAAAS